MATPETVTDNSTPVTTPATPPQAAAVDPKTEAKFTQEDLDKVAGNRAKEAAAAAVKKILKELGIDNADDPDALKTVKTKLTAAQQAEEANKSELQKLTEKLDAETKKRGELETAIEQARQREVVNTRNTKVIEALITAKVSPTDAEDLRILLSARYPDNYNGVVDEDGKITEKGMKALVEKAKETYPKYFANPAPGSPSNYEGRVPDLAKDRAKKILGDKPIVKL